MPRSENRLSDNEERCIARWLSERSIDIPSKNGRTMQMQILRLYECRSVNGLPLDVLVAGRASKRAPTRKFGVIFSQSKPEQQYPIDVYWARLLDKDGGRVELTQLPG
ncbi:MAG: hypothetical protein AAF699_16780 [Pseudomonadota bacterium]